jgi:arylsulfatase A-like enzyme
LSIYNKINTLAQLLRERGYYSAAFVSNWTLKKKLTHLDRGFDSYTEVLTKRRWYGVVNPEGEAPVVNQEVFKWLYNNYSKNIFLFVHYTEPHDPYVYHEEFDRNFESFDPAIYPDGSNPKKIKRYDTEIGFVDFHAGELIGKLKEYGRYDDSLIIFLADHGESFGEHDYYGHGRRLYNSGLHVPLIVKLPGNESSGREIDRIVSLLDVTPTILSVIDYPVPEEMEGENLFEHKNDRLLFFESYRGAVHSKKSNLFHLKVKPVRYALIKDGMKLILDNRFEAYDIEKDPFELMDMYDVQDNAHAEMTVALIEFINMVKKFIEYSKKYYKQRSKLSKEELEKLRSLGYIK